MPTAAGPELDLAFKEKVSQNEFEVRRSSLKTQRRERIE
jgi:hypothetical protein